MKRLTSLPKWCHSMSTPLDLVQFPSSSTLVSILQERAKGQPEQLAYTFLTEIKRDEVCLTYGELDSKARAIAAFLSTHHAQGDRALLLYPPGLDFIQAFLGCLYAGVVAVPIYLPRRPQQAAHLEKIAADCQATWALTDTASLAKLEKFFATEPTLAKLQYLPIDQIPIDQSMGWQPPPLTQENLAFLQYTSGSTGSPKGVMVSHGNLMHNQQLVKTAFKHTEASKVVGWLPLLHDMGLIGNVLQPLYMGIPSILMSPISFLQKPVRWLQTISDYQATTSGGPNFAYDLCCERITAAQKADLDLSHWQLAFNGAEPVRASTLDRFSEAFAECGFQKSAFYPCYGMAEATLFITGGDPEKSPVTLSLDPAALERHQAVEKKTKNPAQGQTVISCGHTWADQTLLIVDPTTRIACPPKQIGEIWIRSDSVAQGYWNQSVASQDTFQATLADDEAALTFLRTGDLGFISDQELFVTGRLKDIIIVRGQNYYPQDVELTVEAAHDALKSGGGAAFAVELQGQERLIVAQEIKRNYLRHLDASEVINDIRRAVLEGHGLQTYAILLLKTASLPKTSSGKVRRHACREAFLSGSMNIVADWSINPRSKTEFHQLKASIDTLFEQLQPSGSEAIEAVEEMFV